MGNPIELIIEPKTKDLGGFTVQRVLPFVKKKTVGPFIFVDHMGPATFPAGHGMDVRPHPHVGLATVTYLFEGTILHQDNLGSKQLIQPGAVNWMTAGNGIVHSERTPADVRASGQNIHGLQIWVALPKKFEDIDPTFFHHPATTLPEFEIENVKFKLIVGKAFDHEAPVKVFSEMFYVDVDMPAGTKVTWPKSNHEVGIYLIEGDIEIGDQNLNRRAMAVLNIQESSKIETVIRANKKSRLMILGGEPIDGPREIWWNFVASSKDRIEAAKKRWANDEFAKVPGETEFIPLPEN